MENYMYTLWPLSGIPAHAPAQSGRFRYTRFTHNLLVPLPGMPHYKPHTQWCLKWPSPKVTKVHQILRSISALLLVHNLRISHQTPDTSIDCLQLSARRLASYPGLPMFARHFQMHARKFGKAWSIWWCNDAVSATRKPHRGNGEYFLLIYKANSVTNQFHK